MIEIEALMKLLFAADPELTTKAFLEITLQHKTHDLDQFLLGERLIQCGARHLQEARESAEAYDRLDLLSPFNA